MGLNIAGFVIDKNYEKDIPKLEYILSAALTFKKQVIFEDTLKSWKKRSECDIYFSQNGTLVLFAPEYSSLVYSAENHNSLTFCLSEMVMIFIVTFMENGKLRRMLTESEGEITENEGIPFEFEKNEDDKSKLIYHLIEKILGQSFFDIDNAAKCNRYTFKSKI